MRAHHINTKYMTTFKKIINVAAIILGAVFIFVGGTDATVGIGAIIVVLGVNNL